MEILHLILSQMLMMFTFILVGFLFVKAKILPENADTTVARLATFVFVPALTFHNLLSNCTVENFSKNYKLILYGLVLVLVSIFMAYIISGLFIRKASESSEKAYKKNIYKYALTFGNFGFLGNFLVLEIYGSEMLYKYLMFTFFLTVFVYAWGLTILIPKQKSEKKKFLDLLKTLFNPGIIALVAGSICGLLGVKQYIPSFLDSALSNAGNCMGPAGMLLAGIVIGKYDIRKLWSDKKVYAVTFLRLIAIPAVFALVLKALGTAEEVIALMLMAFAAPLGLNTIIFPAAYGGETKTGASMALISNILAIITMPILYYIFLTLL